MRNILFLLAALAPLILVLLLNLTSTQMSLIAIISAVVVVGMYIKNLLLRGTQYDSDSDLEYDFPPHLVEKYKRGKISYRELLLRSAGGDYSKARAMYG